MDKTDKVAEKADPDTQDFGDKKARSGDNGISCCVLLRDGNVIVHKNGGRHGESHHSVWINKDTGKSQPISVDKNDLLARVGSMFEYNGCMIILLCGGKMSITRQGEHLFESAELVKKKFSGVGHTFNRGRSAQLINDRLYFIESLQSALIEFDLVRLLEAEDKPAFRGKILSETIEDFCVDKDGTIVTMAKFGKFRREGANPLERAVMGKKENYLFTVVETSDNLLYSTCFSAEEQAIIYLVLDKELRMISNLPLPSPINVLSMEAIIRNGKTLLLGVRTKVLVDLLIVHPVDKKLMLIKSTVVGDNRIYGATVFEDGKRALVYGVNDKAALLKMLKI